MGKQIFDFAEAPHQFSDIIVLFGVNNLGIHAKISFNNDMAFNINSHQRLSKSEIGKQQRHAELFAFRHFPPQQADGGKIFYNCLLQRTEFFAILPFHLIHSVGRQRAQRQYKIGYICGIYVMSPGFFFQF